MDRFSGLLKNQKHPITMAISPGITLYQGEAVRSFTIAP